MRFLYHTDSGRAYGVYIVVELWDLSSSLDLGAVSFLSLVNPIRRFAMDYCAFLPDPTQQTPSSEVISRAI